MNTENAFFTGRYHRGKELDVLFTPGHQEGYLRRYYDEAQGIISDAGWQSPLTMVAPDILLMGFEGAHTATTFIQFVQGRTPDATITLADFSPHPLQAATEAGIAALPNIQLAQQDTTNLTFPDNSFDMIETDNLLQFLSPEEKSRAVAQWYRILKPDGIVTTRDKLMQSKTGSEWDIFIDAKQYTEARFGIDTYPTTVGEMRDTFSDHGFSPIIQKIPYRPLTHHIVAQKPGNPAQ